VLALAVEAAARMEMRLPLADLSEGMVRMVDLVPDHMGLDRQLHMDLHMDSRPQAAHCTTERC
jgi:hypothetical protein